MLMFSDGLKICIGYRKTFFINNILHMKPWETPNPLKRHQVHNVLAKNKPQSLKKLYILDIIEIFIILLLNIELSDGLKLLY